MSFFRCRRGVLPSFAPPVRLAARTRTFASAASAPAPASSSSSRPKVHLPTAPTIQWTPKCPDPTCECASAPENLEIDRKAPLWNTMPHYAEQVVLCTGKEDWTSKVEDEQGLTGEFVRNLRSALGLGVKGEGPEKAVFDPFHNVAIIASSFRSASTSNGTSAFLFPSFKYIPEISANPEAISRFTSAFLKAETLHPAHHNLPLEQQKRLTRDSTLQTSFSEVKDVEDIVVMICGHGGRDKRCGIMGPILQGEFERQLERKSVPAKVGLISHIGGHKYAGNVIIYIPPSLADHPLQGMGIWYGRVGPKEVEGIIEETVHRGKVIRELCRGGVGQGGFNLSRF